MKKLSHALTPEKAKKILKDGSVRGHPLTSKQKGFFGARAGGAAIKRIKHRMKKGSALFKKDRETKDGYR